MGELNAKSSIQTQAERVIRFSISATTSTAQTSRGYSSRHNESYLKADSNTRQARLNDFDQNLNLGPQGYNTAVALLTVGYMIGQLPSNMLLTRVRPGIYLSGCALIWSIVSACTAAANNETSLFVIRFFLGLTEAPLFPGAVFILSAWYTRKELALRITILYSGLVLGQACSGLIAAGVFYGLSNVNGLYGW